MGTEKRERQKANRALKHQQEVQSAARRKTYRKVAIGVGAVVAIILFVWIASNIVGTDDDEPTTDAPPATLRRDHPGHRARLHRRLTPMTPMRLAAALGAALLLVAGCASDSDESGADSTGTSIGCGSRRHRAARRRPSADCPPIEGADSQTRQFDSAPPACLEPGTSYEAIVTTNTGEFTIAVDPDTAPVAANNFVFLARNQYFDDTVCHRIIPNFVVQCGDPTATGTGGPGYTIVDEPPTVPYEIGSIAMAKTAAPDSAGSQFFVITGSDGSVTAARVRTVRPRRRRLRHRASRRWPPPAHRRANRANRSRSNRSASSNADAQIHAAHSAALPARLRPE